MGFQFSRRQIARRVFGLGYFTSVEYFISRHHALYIGTLYNIELAAHRHASRDPVESAFCVNAVYET